MIRLPQYLHAEVIADPRRGFGQPVFAHGGARVEDVLGRFQAGEPLEVVAEEYGVPMSELQDAPRVATRHAAPGPFIYAVHPTRITPLRR